MATVLADWQPGDSHKMHYPQLPDETGWAVNATQPLILADDFMCSETGWIKDVHFWGAWMGGQEGVIDHFVLSLHADIPAEQNPDGYSMPGETLREWEIYEWAIVPIDPPTAEGWYDPLTGVVISEDHVAYYQYNVILPREDWFHQDSGTIYWLNISAVVQDPTSTWWGWKSTLNHWNDDAVWAEWGDLSWVDMYEPATADTTINPFQITIDPTGQFIQGYGGGAYGNGWYYYPEEEWWNVWFYDHPLDTLRWKEIFLMYDIVPMDPGQESYIEVAINWSLETWPNEEEPPLPGADPFIGRAIVYAGMVEAGHYEFPWEILEYNPVWVSVDVRGYNFDIPFGEITHICATRDPISLDLSFVITGGGDTCEYYKSPYGDYAPQGMPDFDMKQNGFIDGQGNWSHDGPAALANCLWWFDSKFEPLPVDPRPFWPASSHIHNDNYPLVNSYDPSLNWDDHDTNNVWWLINDLAANYVNTNGNGGIGGTALWDMQNGLRTYLAAKGLTGKFRDTIVVAPTFDYIKKEVLDCQDVILLLGFYEDFGANLNPIGWHYITTAGVCTTQTQICISDPWMDALEGEPPAGSAHGGTIHNDADNISGPHGQIQHDPYYCTSTLFPGFTQAVEVLNYPTTSTMLTNFGGMNNVRDWAPWSGGTVWTIIEYAFVICPDTVIDTCDYYKSPYGDYAPNGMPDFDQKQNSWTDPTYGGWSHCGPVALANCLWWFDSKFEPSPVDPRPFWPGPGNPAANDGYPLVVSYDPTGGWDDHDTNNVIPFVDSLAIYCRTNTSGSGTNVFDLAQGAQDWIDSTGLTGRYNIRVMPIDPEFGFDQIREEVLISQDVILLLGFWEEISPGSCERIGGHYVTVAGTCSDIADSFLCISDPYFDMHEGEPPAGSAHGSSVHNDAYYISGPHGTIYHDRYQVVTNTCQPVTGLVFVTELAGYPVNSGNVPVFYGLNPFDPSIDPIPPQGGTIHTIIEYAVIICPDSSGSETGACCDPTTGACYETDSLTCVNAGHDFQGSGTSCMPNPCDTCDYQMPGDVNGSGAIDISDITFLVNYLYLGGSAPPTPANADVNGDCCIDYRDVLYLIDNLYSGGPAPVSCTCVNPPVCIPAAPDHTLGVVRHNTDGYSGGDPTGTQWHELWPDYCQNWSIINWIDNSDGTLSWCDTVDFSYLSAPYFHSIEHVERVTTTLTLYNAVQAATMYVDRIDTLSATDAIGTFWHEVYPTYCEKYCLVYTSGTGAGPVAVGDNILMQSLPSGTAVSWQVTGVDTDVVSTPLPVVGDEYDHNLNDWELGSDPVGSEWKELWPNLDDLWRIEEWRDNGTGILDYCDTIMMRGIDMTDSTIWKHIEDATTTIELFDGTDTLLFDYMRVSPMYNYLNSPIGSWWFQVYPSQLNRMTIVGWIDNGNGYIDSCDWIDLEWIDGVDSGTVVAYHVDGVRADIISTIIEPPDCCQIRGDINHSGSGPDIADLVYLVTYMFQGGPPPPCMAEANINGSAGSDVPDISDLVWLVSYMFQNGPAPVPCP